MYTVVPKPTSPAVRVEITLKRVVKYYKTSDPKYLPDKFITSVGDQIQNLPSPLDIEYVTSSFDEDKVDDDDG